MYYLSNVFPPVPGAHTFDHYFPLEPVLSGTPTARPPALLLLAGYSYGALLTRHLPNVPVLLNRFSKVLKTSTEAEIRKRASFLAGVTAIDVLASPLRAARKKLQATSHTTPVTDGVDDASATDGEGTRELNEILAQERAKIKEEHMQVLQKPFVRKEKKNSWPDQQYGEGPSEDDYIGRVDVPTPKTHYMLISLLLEPAASVVTGFRKLVHDDMDVLDLKLLYNRTVIIHGVKDGVTSLRKIKYWAFELVEESEGRCLLTVEPRAGHFWRDEVAMENLKKMVAFWTEKWLRIE